PNLVPLRTIARDLNVRGKDFVVNFVGNLAAFLPLGALLRRLWGSRASAQRVALAGMALSLAIELLQFLSGRRVADVDDVLLNTLGALLGYMALAGGQLLASLAKPRTAPND
ncbi:MAG: VanZ family protein, partial [Isosphaeraceae bacterium]|nr:VanZ family protein [Isosphaeraceae bacterium]